MDSEKIERRLIERLATAEAEPGACALIPVVIQCLGTGFEGPDEADVIEGPREGTQLAFRRLHERLAELGMTGEIREVPVSNALEVRLTPAQIRALAAHPAVGRIILSRHAGESEAAPPAAPTARRQGTRTPDDITAALSKTIIGQTAAIQAIVPYVSMYEAGLAPTDRPVGVFLLLGPTGTGKTRTVEALAETLHGSDQFLVRVDCSEFQEDHEIAKLIGAPPGYIGHRETPALLTAQCLAAVTSPDCDLSIVLFDEIEKAAPTLTRLLLGVLDRAILRLGDGSRVSFERSLIFLTSNLGAQDMMKELTATFGFTSAQPAARSETSTRLESIAGAAVRRAFSPEFINRIDAVVTYRPLDDEALDAILTLQIDQLQQHIHTRLGPSGFVLDVPRESRRMLLRAGASTAYGARELRRTVHRQLTQPLAALVVSGKVDPGSRVQAVPVADGQSLELRVEPPTGAPVGRPRVLVVDDNRPLLDLMRGVLSRAGWEVSAVETAQAALAETEGAAVALIDYLLPDASGLDLAMELKRRHPGVYVVVMSGVGLPADDEATCRQAGFLTLSKPFRVPELLAIVQRAEALRAVGAD